MRVLLVEDEPEIAAFVIRFLKDQGFSIDHVMSAEKGEFMAKTNDYDVILLDVMLPDGDGFGVCQRIREAQKKTPIMMLTVKSEVKDKVYAFELGADDYLIKPFAIEELLVRIRALLRRPQVMALEIYKVGNIVLDTIKRTVIFKGQPLELRTKEFALLEYLLRNRTIVQSRSMLLEHVWDMNVDPFTNTVDVHVRSLRRKLDDEAGNFIQTVHGIGYKID